MFSIKNKNIPYIKSIKWFECVDDKYNHGDCEHIYIFEHEDVYTYGRSVVKNDKIPSYINNIKTEQADRGGLWTWHGKGQVMIYFILNIRKRKMTLQDWFNIIEPIFVKLIQQEINNKQYQVYADKDKRGFWVKNIQNNYIAKVGFIGLRIKNGFLTHGISINYNNNLQAFKYINPCGLGDVKITSIKELKNKTYKVKHQDEQKEIRKFKEKIKKALSTAF